MVDCRRFDIRLYPYCPLPLRKAVRRCGDLALRADVSLHRGGTESCVVRPTPRIPVSPMRISPCHTSCAAPTGASAARAGQGRPEIGQRAPTALADAGLVRLPVMRELRRGSVFGAGSTRWDILRRSVGEHRPIRALISAVPRVVGANLTGWVIVSFERTGGRGYPHRSVDKVFGA